MSLIIKDGQLAKTIRSADRKLVAIDFMNDSCPPCRAIQPYWESLAQQYLKQVIFCTVKCSECPTESSEYGIRATPTFVFVVTGKVVERFEGADKRKISETIEKFKANGGFTGAARSLGSSPESGNDFFANLQRQAHERAQGKPAERPAEKPAEKPVMQAPEAKPVPIVATVPEHLKEELLGMGFTEEQVTEAYMATHSESLDAILDYIQDKQDHPEKYQAPKQGAREERVANDLQKPLDAAGEEAQRKLVEMGYDAEMALIAINCVGHEDLTRCAEVIGKIQRGEPIPMPKHKLTQEELDAKLAHYKEVLAKKKEEREQKASPQTTAQMELKRRKDVQDQIEAKKRFEEMREQQALREAQKERIREKQERERVLQRIQRQRDEQKAAAGQTSQATQAPKPAASRPPSDECTLRIVFADQSTLVQKFKISDTLLDVERFIRTKKPGSASPVFEIPYPRQVVQRSAYNKTFEEWNWGSRAQIMVKNI